MTANNPKSVIIIGAGIAGLSAGVYAQMNGYRSRIFEMHTIPGGLMTAWKRKGYTVDGCIHWLVGSNPESDYHPLWQEIGLIQGREFFNPEVFTRVEDQNGEALNLYCDLDRLERHLLEVAPEDRDLIREVCQAARAFTRLPMVAEGSLLSRLRMGLQMVPLLPKFLKWTKMNFAQFGPKFKNPLLKKAFSELWYPEMTVVTLLMTLAWLQKKDAGYPIGGSLPMARAVEKRYCGLGGEIVYGARVSKILVEQGRAVGVRLADGREERADVVISAADGHATLFDMLEGRYLTDEWRNIFANYPIFPPLVHIGLGVKRTFPDLPGLTGGFILYPKEPVMVAGKPVDRLDMMVYNMDPTLAPEGKTAITIMIGTEYDYWKELHGDSERYEAEKERVALDVIQRLDARFPGLAGQVEMADVATPLTFERYTGNWQGSFEGWLPTPKTVTKPIAKTLPGLENFYMAGQWVQPGGGLPTGLVTGRDVIKTICKKDGVRFKTTRA